MGTKRATKEKLKAARDRFKIHLRHKGQDARFELTEGFCYYWWHQLNFTTFDGILSPPVRIELKNFRTTSGWCVPWRANAKERRVRIGIDLEIWERKHFLCVLSHEMVHQWGWEIANEWTPKDAHGELFMSWKNKLKTRTGLPLQITY